MASAKSINKDENFYKRVLNRSTQRFLEDLDPVPVLDLFLEKDYLTYTQLRDIQEQRLTSDKTREIIKKVRSKGVQGYKTFKAVLRESHQEHLAEFLERQESVLVKDIKMAEKEKEEKGKQIRKLETVVHVQTKSQPFKCCGKSYVERSSYEAHQRVQHEKSKLKCDTCNETFTRKTSLKRHMKRHAHTEKRAFMCSTCKCEFQRRDELNDHIRGVHEKSKRFRCSVCYKRYAWRTSLRRHQSQSHQ